LLVIAVVIVSTFFIHYQSTRPIEIQAESAPTGQTVTTIQRLIFAKELQRKFRDKWWLASFDLKGSDGKIMNIYWESINRSLVKQFVSRVDLIQDIREMGFKKLVLKNGKQQWEVDLKN
jgi:hypothetical protein